MTSVRLHRYAMSCYHGSRIVLGVSQEGYIAGIRLNGDGVIEVFYVSSPMPYVKQITITLYEENAEISGYDFNDGINLGVFVYGQTAYIALAKFI